MRINKYFTLRKSMGSWEGFTPDRTDWLDLDWVKPTKKEYDKLCIIHYPDLGNGFVPIVLGDTYVSSESRWSVKIFYAGVKRLLKLGTKLETHYSSSIQLHTKRNRYSMKVTKFYADGNEYEWGCRTFTEKQLLLIKKTMEENYSKKQLGMIS